MPSHALGALAGGFIRWVSFRLARL